MAVKSSGRRLADIDSGDYFYEVSVSDGQFIDSLTGQAGKPSIEVFLHALLPSKYVLHLHSARAVALSMIASASKETTTEINQFGITLLPYSRPGAELKESIATRLGSLNSNTILLTNHGTLFQANSVQTLADLVTSFECFAESKLAKTKFFNFDTHSMSTDISEATAAHLRWQAENNWRISPDHVVFLGTHPANSFINELRGGVTIRELIDSTELTQGSISTVQEQLLWFVNVALCLPLKPLITLSESEANFLRSWDAEKHRLYNNPNL
jgi:rhamnose utilization protein RhaD (predicted bifunctional aldolase and dehydrogenase)